MCAWMCAWMCVCLWWMNRRGRPTARRCECACVCARLCVCIQLVSQLCDVLLCWLCIAVLYAVHCKRACVCGVCLCVR